MNRFRRARADLFLRLMHPQAHATVLDLGGSSGHFAALIHQSRPDLRFTIADTKRTRPWLGYGFAEAALDPDGPLPFGDGEFDIVLCNSVIEHVSRQRCRDEVMPERAWRSEALKRQRQFAEEIARVGRRYFRPDAASPFSRGRPSVAAVHGVAATRGSAPAGPGHRPVLDQALRGGRLAPADRTEMADLFPGANLYIERRLGLPKSIVAWK